MKYLLISLIVSLMFTSIVFCNDKIDNTFSDDSSSIRLNEYNINDKWLSYDKLHHFYYSASLTGLSYLSMHYILKIDNSNKNLSRVLSGCSVLSLGIIKELIDRTHSSTGFSYKDLTFDLLGVLTGLILFSIYER